MNVFQFLVMMLLSLQLSACVSGEYTENYDDWTSTNDTLLLQIEDKVYGAFIASFSQQKVEPLVEIIGQLEEVRPQAAQICDYWLGYAYYYKSIFFIKYAKKEESEKAIKAGIDLLDKKKKKNSEDLALLALLQSFSTQFEKGMATGIVSNKAKKNATKAIELDESNMRAHYVAGSLDYYTPEQFGGGKKVEEHLRKAIELPSQKNKNPILPSWGKEEAYVLLIQYFIDKEQKDKAVPVYKEAIELFPESYQLGSLAKKLI